MNCPAIAVCVGVTPAQLCLAGSQTALQYEVHPPHGKQTESTRCQPHVKSDKIFLPVSQKKTRGGLTQACCTGRLLTRACWIPAWCLCTLTAVFLFLCFIGGTFGQWLYAAVSGYSIMWLYSHQLTEK